MSFTKITSGKFQGFSSIDMTNGSKAVGKLSKNGTLYPWYIISTDGEVREQAKFIQSNEENSTKADSNSTTEPSEAQKKAMA
jgi:hypothetical protein